MGEMEDKVHLSPAEAEVGASIAFEFKGILGLQSADSDAWVATIRSNQVKLTMGA